MRIRLTLLCLLSVSCGQIMNDPSPDDAGEADASIQDPQDAGDDGGPTNDAHLDSAHDHTVPDAPSDSGVEFTDAGGGRSFVEAPSIPSDFDIETLLQPSWGTGAIPPTNEPDVVGAFRFICNPSHLSYDDPVVFPGEPGRAHLHQFFGNTLADGDSTYRSLRTSGESTCNNRLNRSAYWIPAMMNGRGQVVRPDYISIYYKRYPASSPRCSDESPCIGIPRGLRYVFGDNGNPDFPPPAYFNCQGDEAMPGRYESIPAAAANCGADSQLGFVVSAPDCWNGRDLDSADHRSHMAYRMRDRHTGATFCPATHPFQIPTFTIGAWYTTDDTLDRSGAWGDGVISWHLSSDHIDETHAPGHSAHADWFGAWDDEVLRMWTVDGCIDGFLNCSGGDLGTGQQLRTNYDFSWTADPRVVDPPPGGTEGGHGH